MNTPPAKFRQGGAQLCHFCGKGFTFDLPAVYVPVLAEFHECCLMCIGTAKVFPYKGGVVKQVRHILRRLCYGDTSTQGGLTL